MLRKKDKNYKIIDAHLHLPWEDRFKTINEKYEYLKRQMKENQIDHGILIADSEIESSIGNNDQCLEIVEKDSKLSMVYGFSPLQRYDEQMNQLIQLLVEGKVVGVKLYPGHEDFSMNDIRLRDIFEVCIKYDVPLLVHTEWNDDYYPQYSHPFYIKQIAERYAKLNIVCCHIWMGRVLKSIRTTMKQSNVYYDVSSFVASEEYESKYPGVFPDMDKAVEILNKVLDLVPDKVMFGSDFGTLDISDHVSMVTQCSCSEEKLFNLLSKTAEKVFKL